MNKVVLNNELIAIKAGDITVYNYDGETREYISTSTEYLAIGVGIPACSCLLFRCSWPIQNWLCNLPF